MIQKLSECTVCGVAFDTGYRYCREEGCPGRPKQESKAPKPRKPRKKYEYKTRLADPIHSRYMSVRYRAYKRGYDFDLTPELIEELLHQPCYYCNSYDIPQIDRIDSTKGYTKDNVVPACKRCNTVKSMYLTSEEMLIVAKALGWRE